MGNPLALFRFDAAPTLGAGHMVRCGVLARAFAARGWRVRRAVSAETVAMLGSHDDALIMPPDPADEPDALRAAEPEGCALLVVDHYGRDAGFERRCRPWAARILALDDLADRPHDADWLLDPTPGRDAADYHPLLARKAALLLGPAHALIDQRFVAARPVALARRRSAEPPRRLLVSPGGTDPRNLAGAAIEALARASLDLDIDVALLPGAPHLDALRSQAGARVTIHCPATDMARLMLEADLAIGAAGGSAWERCCLGLPTVLVVTADNQRANARGLVEAGAALRVGTDWRFDAAELGAAVTALARDDARRCNMAEAAAALCDGQGVSRVLAALGVGP